MLVPKNPDGFCLRMTMSLGPGAMSSTIWLPSTLLAATTGFSAPRLFFQLQEPESQLSSRRTPVV